MLQLFTEAVRGTAVEVFVQQHHSPERHPQRAFWDQSRHWRCRHNARDLWALTHLLVAEALDAPYMGLDLDFDNARLFCTGERQERGTTSRAVLRVCTH